jgi:hypothetical protein
MANPSMANPKSFDFIISPPACGPLKNSGVSDGR